MKPFFVLCFLLFPNVTLAAAVRDTWGARADFLSYQYQGILAFDDTIYPNKPRMDFGRYYCLMNTYPAGAKSFEDSCVGEAPITLGFYYDKGLLGDPWWTWRHAESYFQAMKKVNANGTYDAPSLSEIHSWDRSGKIWEILKKYKGQNKARSDWQKINLYLMLDLVRAKFMQNQNMKNILLETYPEYIVEEATDRSPANRDSFFGNAAPDGKKPGQGSNILGQILMHVRRELMEGSLLDLVLYTDPKDFFKREAKSDDALVGKEWVLQAKDSALKLENIPLLQPVLESAEDAAIRKVIFASTKATPALLADLVAQKYDLNKYISFTLPSDSQPINTANILVAAFHFWDSDQFKELLSLDMIDINARNKADRNRTPLHYAAMSNDIFNFLKLQVRGADIYAQDSNGQTPFAILEQKAYTARKEIDKDIKNLSKKMSKEELLLSKRLVKEELLMHQILHVQPLEIIKKGNMKLLQDFFEDREHTLIKELSNIDPTFLGDDEKIVKEFLARWQKALKQAKPDKPGQKAYKQAKPDKPAQKAYDNKNLIDALSSLTQTLNDLDKRL